MEAPTQASKGFRAVRDPKHAWKLHAREPGDPSNARHDFVSGPVGEGRRPTKENIEQTTASQTQSWDAVVCSMFSLVGRLPSMPSANGFPLLFGHFVGTVRPSDSPATCMLDFWFMTFSNRPAHEIVTGVAGVSRFSRMEFPCMLGVSDCAEPFGSLRWRFHRERCANPIL